jgi:DNA-binding GntR family transcriptional regulator
VISYTIISTGVAVLVTPGGKPRAIDRNSYEPAYMQIVHIVTEEIAAGVLRPGDQLPTEAQFRSRFNVSPMTIRRAINILVERGFVSTTQGKGTFVRGLDMGEAVFRLQELKENWTNTDHAVVRLLEASILSLDERVAGKLALSAGDRGIYIRRLVLREGLPAIYHREFLVYDPLRPVVEAQLQITSLAGLLQGQTAEGLRRGSLIMEAVNLNEEEAAILHIPAHSAAFSLEHTFYDFGDRPVSWGWFLCRADLFNLTAQIGAGAGP